MLNFDDLKRRAALQWPDLARYMETARIENVPILYGRDGQIMIAPDRREMLTVTVVDKSEDQELNDYCR